MRPRRPLRHRRPNQLSESGKRLRLARPELGGARGGGQDDDSPHDKDKQKKCLFQLVLHGCDMDAKQMADSSVFMCVA